MSEANVLPFQVGTVWASAPASIAGSEYILKDGRVVMAVRCALTAGIAAKSCVKWSDRTKGEVKIALSAADSHVACGFVDNAVAADVELGDAFYIYRRGWAEAIAGLNAEDTVAGRPVVCDDVDGAIGGQAADPASGGGSVGLAFDVEINQKLPAVALDAVITGPADCTVLINFNN